MNMFKYFMVSVMCGCISMVNAQEPSAAKPECSGVAHVQEPVIDQDKTTEQNQSATNGNELSEGQDIDFEKWAKSLDMTEEEKTQFLAEMNEELSSEAEVLSQDAPKMADKTGVLEDQKIGDSDVKVQVNTELPSSAN